VAVLFIWLSFRGANLGEIWRLSQHADPLFLALIFFSGLASHIFRAYRWLVLLKPLSTKKISLWSSFSAIIFGYAVNVVVPRGGEIVRLITLSKLENLAWASVLPTLLIDRLLDIAMLALLLGAALTVLPPAITTAMPWIVPSGITLSISTILFLMLLPRLGKIAHWFMALEPVAKILSVKLKDTLSNLIEQFDQGTRALTNPLAYPALALLSIAIWLFYWLNLLLVIYAFHLQQQVTITDTMIVFALASASVLVPTPGAIGSYHFVVSQALMLTAQVGQDQALACATVSHAISMMVVPVLASLFCISVDAIKQKRG
jgi:glycosyltransferase 2 family protein